MDRLLLVANQTLGGDVVMRWLQERLSRDPFELHILVPSNVDTPGFVHDDDTDRALARARLNEALELYGGKLGIPVTGEIGDARPVDAINDVLRNRDVDEIVLSTLPPGASRWLRMDLVRRVERSVSVPVVHLVGEKTPAPAH